MDLSSLIKAVHVRSNFTPDIDLVDPLGPAAPNPYMEKLQPQIIIDTDAGPITLNPYGVPGPTQWDTVLAGFGGLGIFVLALAGYGVWKLMRG